MFELIRVEHFARRDITKYDGVRLVEVEEHVEFLAVEPGDPGLDGALQKG